MPSPFPGMDPFIESQKWEDFHASYVGMLRELLVPRVRPRYIVDVERYVYVNREEEEVVRIIAPDALVADTGRDWRESAATAGTVTLQPVKHRMRLPRRGQPYLVIRTRRKETVVTVIELLSPWNKTPEAGVAEYLAKRANVLQSSANVVEFDLLRGGERLPTIDPLQDGDFYAFVSRPRLRRNSTCMPGRSEILCRRSRFRWRQTIRTCRSTFRPPSPRPTTEPATTIPWITPQESNRRCPRRTHRG